MHPQQHLHLLLGGITIVDVVVVVGSSCLLVSSLHRGAMGQVRLLLHALLLLVRLCCDMFWVFLGIELKLDRNKGGVGLI